MKPAEAFATIAFLGAALWIVTRPTASSSPSSSSSSPVDDLLAVAENVVEDLVSAVTPGPWIPPDRAAPYLDAIHAAEDRQGIPRDLLTRLLYQESRFRPEIIDGRVRSSAGAVGIAQFMPTVSAAYGIDATDPWQSIDAAARELASLYRRFKAWPDAIASYNWGQGNWNAFLRTGRGAAGQARPRENIDYVAQIAGDLGLA